MKKTTARILCALMAVVMLAMLAMPYIARAVTSDDLQQLEQELQDVRNEGKELEERQEQQEAYKENLEQQNEIIRQQITTIAASIETTKQALAEKQAELDEKRREIEETDALFAERLRAMQVNHSSGLLSTLLAVNTFDELLTASTTLSRISAADTTLLKKLGEERTEIERQEAEINLQLTQLEEDQAALENKKQQLAANIQAADASINETEALQIANKEEEARLVQEYNEARKQAEAEMQRPSDNPEFVGGAYNWPVPGYYNISSPYGWRTLYGQPDFHTGIDISRGSQASIYGANIVASLSGTVQTVVYGSRGYGYYVIVDHGGNNKTLYGHMSRIDVTVGQQVTGGVTVLGGVGSTGNSTGPHLHFEIRLGGQQVDPAPYLGR